MDDEIQKEDQRTREHQIRDRGHILTWIVVWGGFLSIAQFSQPNFPSPEPVFVMSLVTPAMNPGPVGNLSDLLNSFGVHLSCTEVNS